MNLSDNEVEQLADLLLGTEDDPEIGIAQLGIAQLGIDPSDINNPYARLSRVGGIRQCEFCSVWRRVGTKCECAASREKTPRVKKPLWEPAPPPFVTRTVVVEGQFDKDGYKVREPARFKPSGGPYKE